MPTVLPPAASGGLARDEITRYQCSECGRIWDFMSLAILCELMGVPHPNAGREHDNGRRQASKPRNHHGQDAKTVHEHARH